MGIVGTALTVLAGLAMMVFSIQILILAFKTSVGWGLASLIIPFAVFVFVVKYWDQAKTPFLRWLACLPVSLIGVAISAWSAMSSMPTTP